MDIIITVSGLCAFMQCRVGIFIICMFLLAKVISAEVAKIQIDLQPVDRGGE